MSKTLKNFYDALQRLIDGKPKVIMGVYSINNDTVALEAGRKRGTIKKSRPELSELLMAIAEAEARRTGQSGNAKIDIRDMRLQEAQEKIKDLENQLSELEYKYKKQLAQLNILSFRNLQLHREVQRNNKIESNLLDFIK